MTNIEGHYLTDFLYIATCKHKCTYKKLTIKCIYK
jgi:hypothetical protein